MLAPNGKRYVLVSLHNDRGVDLGAGSAVQERARALGVLRSIGRCRHARRTRADACREGGIGRYR